MLLLKATVSRLNINHNCGYCIIFSSITFFKLPGMHSVHNNQVEDRRWKPRTCQVRTICFDFRCMAYFLTKFCLS